MMNFSFEDNKTSYPGNSVTFHIELFFRIIVKIHKMNFHVVIRIKMKFEPKM